MKNTNYFGRACRFLGRISLFVSFILCVGIGGLLLSTIVSGKPLIDNAPNQSPTPAPTTSSPSRVSHTSITTFLQNPILSWVITTAIIAITIIAFIYLAYKYNTAIRKLIASVAKLANIPIHILELILTLIIWSSTLVMLFFCFPVVTTILIIPFIINELLFIFGWVSYGMPDYIV